MRFGIDDFAAALAEGGAPEGEVDLLRYIFGEVLDGRNAHVTDGVQRALGRPPRDFADYARAAAASGAWDATRVSRTYRAPPDPKHRDRPGRRGRHPQRREGLGRNVDDDAPAVGTSADLIETFLTRWYAGVTQVVDQLGVLSAGR